MGVIRLALLIPILGSFSVWLGLEWFRALRSGIANAAGTLIRRRERPWAFWSVVLVQLGWLVVVSITLVRLVAEALLKAF